MTNSFCNSNIFPHSFNSRRSFDLAMRESVVDKFNSKKPQQKMQLIPVGQALNGEPLVTVSEETAIRLQTIAWESVKKYKAKCKP
jgi:hypothetical protein